MAHLQGYSYERQSRPHPAQGFHGATGAPAVWGRTERREQAERTGSKEPPAAQTSKSSAWFCFQNLGDGSWNIYFLVNPYSRTFFPVIVQRE